MNAAKLHVSFTDCLGEPELILLDSGEAELGKDLDALEFASDVSGSEFTEATGWLGSLGEGDLESGGDDWLGTQMYQAKEALSRRTLNTRLAEALLYSFTYLNCSPVLFLTALRFSSFSILAVMRCPPFSSL